MIDLQKFIVEQNLLNFPIGLSGCKTSFNYDSCDYDITIFDEKSKSDSIIFFENNFIKIHHGSLKETKSNVLIQYDSMEILQDESWELRIFLSKIKEIRNLIFNDFAKNCLIDSLFCSEKTNSGLDSKNPFASCWQKCASFYLADAISALNQRKPSPSHMLDMMRHFEKNQINQYISTVNETVGIERATQSLLERMLKSTIGFSKIIEKNDQYRIIHQKYNYFIKNSMLSDCYFYLGYLNKENFIRAKSTLDKNSDYFHILKIAFDIESDQYLLRQQSEHTKKSCQAILDFISQA